VNSNAAKVPNAGAENLGVTGFSAFTFAYALFEIPTGWWADRIGSRRVLTRIVTWWSVFTGLTGVAWNFPSLLALRALFGAGEAGAWPTVARALSRWFPEQERGTAQGIFFMGAAFGEMWREVLHEPWGRLANLYYLVGLVWRSLFGTFAQRSMAQEMFNDGPGRDLPTWAAWAGLAAVAALSVWLLERRLRAREVVS